MGNFMVFAYTKRWRFRMRGNFAGFGDSEQNSEMSQGQMRLEMGGRRKIIATSG